MPRIQLREYNRHLTSSAGLMLIGHCLAFAQVERLDVQLPKRGKIRLSDLVKSYLGLLTLGKSDFEAGYLVPSSWRRPGTGSLAAPAQYHGLGVLDSIPHTSRSIPFVQYQ